MGEVYAGFDEKLQREVALKALHGDRLETGLRARLLREARALSQLSHPNICAIYDLIEHETGDFLVLERIRGRNLREVLRDGIEPALRLRIAEQIAEALAAAHARGVVHRDLKLANVMLTEGDRQVKVLDFGLARISRDGMRSEDPDDTAAPAVRPSGEWTSLLHTELGSVVGTAACMSPEQARGEVVTTASDVYSFGLLLQELFTGKPPYDPGLPFHLLLVKAREGDTLPATAIDHDLAVLIQRMKSLAPAERPTAAEVRQRLAWIHDKPRRRARWLAAGAAVLLLAAGTVKYVMDVRRERDLAVAAQAEAESARAEAEEVARFLEGVFQVSDPRSGQGGEVRARELLDRGAERVRTELRDQPLVRARLMGVIGRIDLQLGLYREAEPLFAEALALRERQLGPESLEVAESLHDLGRARLLQSRVDAEPLLRQAVALREKILGPDDPAVAEALQTLGTFLSRIPASQEAAPVLRRALQILEARPPSPELASVVYELAVAQRRDQPVEAEALFRRALALRQALFPPDHPDVIASVVALGALFGNSGRCLDAIPLYESALRLQEKRLGPEHPLTALTLSNLGSCYIDAGRFAAAERILLQALAIREKTFGRDHAELVPPLRHLAEVYRRQGRRREMEAVVARGLAIADRSFRPGNAQSQALRAILSKAR
jgi:serine/threonine-protein kinase